jgi:hypothetical protein
LKLVAAIMMPLETVKGESCQGHFPAIKVPNNNY